MKATSTLIIVGFIFISVVFWGFHRLFFPKKNGGEETIISLSGKWRFIPGDRPEFVDPDFDDGTWKKVRVPGSWESDGFKDYDGFAWYRTTFKLKEKHLDKNLYLNLGEIDDVDETYLNGASIGKTGEFPPFHQSAYNRSRLYKLPQKYLKAGENALAVRVFDQYGPGGIVSGKIGIVESDRMEPDLWLTGAWKFKTGDHLQWAEPDFDDSEWHIIQAPGDWESQGFKNYDGFAWYRKVFSGRNLDPEKEYVLMLGRIDDLNEAFVNGKLVGKHGELSDVNLDNLSHNATFYKDLRGYFIPKGLINPGKNVVAVRVFDKGRNGGIYQGPVGLATQDSYTRYWLGKKGE